MTYELNPIPTYFAPSRAMKKSCSFSFNDPLVDVLNIFKVTDFGEISVILIVRP